MEYNQGIRTAIILRIPFWIECFRIYSCLYPIQRDLRSSTFDNDFFQDLILQTVRWEIIRKKAAVRISPVPKPEIKWESSSGKNVKFTIRIRLEVRINIDPILSNFIFGFSFIISITCLLYFYS